MDASYRIGGFQPVIRESVLKNLRKPKAKKAECRSAQIDVRNAFISYLFSDPSEVQFVAGPFKLHLGEPVILATSSGVGLGPQLALVVPGVRIATVSTAFPRTEYIATLGHPFFTFRKPIPVAIEEQGGVFSAWSSDIKAFGYGPTELEAIDDFKSAVVELYEVLAEEAHRLGPGPARSFLSLREFVEEKS